MTDEAEILYPDKTIQIGGREVTIREFSFRDGLDLGPMIAGLMAVLDKTVGDGSDLSGLFDALYQYPDVLEHMLLKSTCQDKTWLDGLCSADGDMLVMTFWGVNAGFFTRRLATRRMAMQAGKKGVEMAHRNSPAST
ncbi:DUF6631 family protein [Candidatus Vondammii sp. HM_W22]|uniref:DUF6631 family protein n=1 Tax=Candidatus Vondammii sp. HM_W22 TaxID=2687299 RepID=UPI002E7ADB09|nr:DUF6631 family protein [Candidatus Vondammii sp. HM_W22]